MDEDSYMTEDERIKENIPTQEDMCPSTECFYIKSRTDRCTCPLSQEECTDRFIAFYNHICNTTCKIDAKTPLGMIPEKLSNKLLRFYFDRYVSNLFVRVLRGVQKFVPSKLYSDPWRYVDIYCGTMQRAITVAEFLGGIMPQGMDTIYRKDYDSVYMHHEIMYDNKIAYGDGELCIITLGDALRHTPYPEMLIGECIRSLCKGGMLMLCEFDCQNWPECYYLDFFHSMMFKVMGSDTCLPVYGYRTRQAWRDMVTGSGSMKILSPRRPHLNRHLYGLYVDVFMKMY